MNARQKAKRYKRLYEEYTRLTIKPTIVTDRRKVDTLKFSREYPEVLVKNLNSGCDEWIKNAIQRDLCFELLKKFGDYVDTSIDLDTYNGKYIVTGTINILRRDE